MPSFHGSNKPSRVSEFELIRLITEKLGEPGIEVGPGDDAAVLRVEAGRLAISSDLLVEDVHFRLRHATPEEIGYKAAAVTLSDMAAMGAQPLAMTVDIGSPREQTSLFPALAEGLALACVEAGCSVVGGDLSRAPVLLLSTTAIGRVPGKPLLRSNGRPGDLLAVTGTLGDAAAGFAILEDDLPGYPMLRRRHLRPTARVLAGKRIASLDLAMAAIDISDGLLQDLQHLCRQSEVAAEIWVDHLPLSAELLRYCSSQGKHAAFLAATGGEDFELLMSVSPKEWDRLSKNFQEIGPIQVIGQLKKVTEGESSRIRILERRGNRYEEVSWAGVKWGHDHFA